MTKKLKSILFLSILLVERRRSSRTPRWGGWRWDWGGGEGWGWGGWGEGGGGEGARGRLQW